MIDRFIEMEKGKYAKALKNVTMGEDHIHDQFPSYPIMPNTLIIESMAQTGGILAGHSLDFKRQVFLAKLEKVTFYEIVRPGDQLMLEAWIDDLREEGGRIKAKAMVGETPIADASIMFVCLQNPNGNGSNNGDSFIFGKDLLSNLNIQLNA